MIKDLRIVFMGTPSFAVEVLKTLVEADFNIVGVITAPDKPAGRGRKLSESAVKKYAVEVGLKVLQPTNLKSEAFLEELRELRANLQIVVAFRMLPRLVWAMPEYGTFNLHASLLPDYRGAAPINWAIIKGEKTSGVTTFFIDDKIDTGAIILKEEVHLDPGETAGSLHDRLMKKGSELVLRTVELISEGKIETEEQDEFDTTKEAPKLTAENTRINWNAPAETIERFIRGLNPFPVAWTALLTDGETEKIKIYEADYERSDHHFQPGELVTSKNELKIAAQDGFLRVLELQLPGKRKMKTADLLNGYKFTPDAKVV